MNKNVITKVVKKKEKGNKFEQNTNLVYFLFHIHFLFNFKNKCEKLFVCNFFLRKT